MDIRIKKLKADSEEARQFYRCSGSAIPVVVVPPGADKFWFIMSRLWNDMTFYVVTPDGSVLVTQEYPDCQNTDTQNAVARALLARLVKEFQITIPHPVSLVEKWRNTRSNWNTVYTYNRANKEWEYVQLQ